VFRAEFSYGVVVQTIMPRAYYNEHDPFAAEWLRNLIRAELIAPGDVDERSIEDVLPSDLTGYTQCHFFAGIGGWSYALRLSGWPDDRPVWTGSCPCQPFSAAGQRKGTADERHLWPAWFHLIEQCEPHVIFGEQVEAAIKHGWLDLVRSDLEGKGYAFGAVGIPAAGVGAPHIRARAWFVAESLRAASERGAGSVLGAQTKVGSQDGAQHGDRAIGFEHGGENSAGELDDALRAGRPERRPIARNGQAAGGGGIGKLGDAERARLAQQRSERGTPQEAPGADSRETAERASPSAFWSAADWLPCRDGKARPVEPGTFPLAHGLPARVGRLRGYGNAIVPQVAAEIVIAYQEAEIGL
jgi:DNA (cytosine-5)-methyltransferase 1